MHCRLMPCLLLAALAATAAHAQTTPPQTAPAALPVTGVTLYTSGVGYFERGGQIEGDVAQTLLFPVGQINDVLKSLVLLDGGGGTIRPVTYGALDPVSKQLQAFSVDVSDNPDPATLLNRMRGASVTVTYTDATGSKTATGTIVGTQTQTVALPNNGGTVQQASLTLLVDGGLKTIPLASVTDTQINDPELRRELGAALAVVAQSRDASKRPVTLTFAGHGRRHVSVGYLTEAPLWQSSYRLVLGKSPALQGWALVQNTGQDDWDNVHLTLVSGRPISFLQDLYTPLYVPRPVVQASVSASPTPQTYNGNLQADGSLPNGVARISALQSNNSLLVEATPEQPTAGNPALSDTSMLGQSLRSRNKGQAGYLVNGTYGGRRSDSITQALVQSGPKTTGAELGTALFTYQIAQPISIGRQKSAMIPFLASPISAQPVSIFNPITQAEHPLLGARVKNTSTLHLMGGPITVFDEGANGTGYVGDALIEDTEPGQTRLLSYAVDLGVDGHSEDKDGKAQTFAVKLYQGNLVIKVHRELSRLYTLKNNSDKPRLVVIEHPYHGEEWTLLEPLKAEERTADLYRFDLPLVAHESRKFTVREAYPDVTAYGLLQADFDTLLFYVKNGEADAAVTAAIKDIVSRRQHVSDLQAKINIIDAQTQAITAGQDRIRSDMRELDRNSALYTRYVGELDAQETKLATLQAQRATLVTELAEAQNTLNDYVANINL